MSNDSSVDNNSNQQSKALQKNNLLQRCMSGGVLGAGVIFCIFFGSYLYTALILTIFVLSVYESVSIITNSKYLNSDDISVQTLDVNSLILRYILIAVFCTIFPCLSLLYLRLVDSAKGFYLTIWLFCAIWSFDTIAFFAGKTIGGPKLAPKISPKKTWSGFIFGIFGSLITSLIIYRIFNFNTNSVLFIAFSIILPILSQAGDLIESKFKRYHNVKDSGSIIPGHGGILDRMDGFLLTAPFLVFVHSLSSIFSSLFSINKLF